MVGLTADPKTERCWAPIALVDLLKQGAWRKPPVLALLAGWIALTLLCGWYGLHSHQLPLGEIRLSWGVVAIFWPLVVGIPVMFWFGLEWALALVIAGSLGVGVQFGLPPRWLIPFGFADAAGLTMMALIYRLSGLSYLARRPAPALAYVMSVMLSSLLLSSGSFFLSQAIDAPARDTLARWYSWWLGGLLDGALAAVLLLLFSDRVERWKDRMFGAPPPMAISFRFLAVGLTLGASLTAALIFGVSDTVWHRLEATFLSGSMDRIKSNMLVLRALWLLLSQVTVMLLVALGAGGVVLAWRWNKAFNRQSVRYGREIEAADRRFRTIFEDAPIGLAHLSSDGHFLQANRKFLTILGFSWEELVQLSYLDLVDASEHARVRERARQVLRKEAEVFEFERAMIGRLGEMVWCNVRISASRSPSGAVEYFILTLEDIRQRRALEQQVQQQNRMEAVGRLAGGVAHDFNNLLTAILGFTEVARTQVSRQQSPVSSLDQVQLASERAAELTRQLLTVGRRDVAAQDAIDLNAEIETTLKLLPPILGPAVEVRFEKSEDLPEVRGDATQISQVIMNLAANARDAMRTGGVIGISTRAVRVETDGLYGLDPGSYVVVEFSDNGEGIPPDLLPRIFEPFFTTKAAGRGTGLGLATVYGIVQQAGGSIQVRSTPALGTTFTIYFPALAAVAEEPAAKSEPASTGVSDARVLLVEDDPAVRSFLANALGKAGCLVAAAENGEDALSLFSSAKFDLIVTDLVMPRMTGIELVKRVSESSPNVPVVFMSGYSTEVQQGGLPGVFLQKPFTMEQLLHAMERAMSAAGGESSRPHNAT